MQFTELPIADECGLVKSIFGPEFSERQFWLTRGGAFGCNGRMIPKKLFIGGCLVLMLVLGFGDVEARGDVRVPKLFSDNMVLQQGMRV